LETEWVSRPSVWNAHRTKEAAARDVGLAFGVPHAVGIAENATYAQLTEGGRIGRSIRLTCCHWPTAALRPHLGLAGGIHPNAAVTVEARSGSGVGLGRRERDAALGAGGGPIF